MITALICDLDDTLYPQAAFLSQAWDHVASAGAGLGLNQFELRATLGAIALEGSDRGRIIDRALEAMGAPETLAAPLVKVFQELRPRHLPPYGGVAERLAALQGTVRMAVLTDGNPEQQRAKLAATGLSAYFDAVICTDEAGRQFRKPHPRGFVEALDTLGTSPAETVMIGDRPSKDVVGAMQVGIRVIRVRQGEHSAAPSLPRPWYEVPTTAMALDIVQSNVPVVA